jgi:hypothetical protein
MLIYGIDNYIVCLYIHLKLQYIRYIQCTPRLSGTRTHNVSGDRHGLHSEL